MWLLLYPRVLYLVAHALCYLVIFAIIEERFRWIYCPWLVRRKTAPIPCSNLELINGNTTHLDAHKLMLADPSAVIHIKRLSKRYHGQLRPAVDNLSKNVRAANVLVFWRPTGLESLPRSPCYLVD
ncbi:hypothetical protein FBUS_09613 [Fasciolopsis buskii]|uniref:Uncharacterized protein n=1 Tax=Fasciolopsis buskii TaxID=27845 RepID=A0A8E0VJJ4_9TREM|nr:hypothetical protein FBUS_09613 [Fasciolopsis buski]